MNHLGSVRKNLDLLPNPKLAKDILYERLRLLENNKIPVYVQDVRQYHELSKYFSEINPKVVIHLAAVSHANRSNKDPHSTFDHSLRTLENALDNAKNVSKCIKKYQKCIKNVLKCTKKYQKCTKLYQKCVKMYENISKSIKMCQNLKKLKNKSKI